jgi:hypothetical protein
MEDKEMNKVFHQTAPIIALNLMPKEFRDFMITNSYTIENIKTDAILPDSVDKDNILNNSIIQHGHSYKMKLVDDKLELQDGDVLQRLIGLCADAHDFYVEGKLDMVRYSLSKATHYRIDALTYPHLHSGKPWSEYHVKFEDSLGKFIDKNKHLLVDIKFEILDEIEEACNKTAREMWYKAKNAVVKYEREEKLTDEEKLEICKVCVKAIGDLWLTIGKELEIIK